MYIQSTIDDIPWPIGIQLVHHSFDKCNKQIYDAETFLYVSGFTIDLLLVERHLKIINGCTDEIILQYLLLLLSLQLTLKIILNFLSHPIQQQQQQHRQYPFSTFLKNRKYFYVYCLLLCVNVNRSTLIYVLLSISGFFQIFIINVIYKLILQQYRQFVKNITRIYLLCKYLQQYQNQKEKINHFQKIVNCWHYIPTLIIINILITVFALRSLYVGTLAIIWTTALSLPQRPTPSVQLAAVCFFLATLTIAARCYASSSTTTNVATAQPLVQFSSKPSSFSPIVNSNSQFYYYTSSNIVLSRLFTTTYTTKTATTTTSSPHHLVQSDTSLIVRNSKKLLYNNNNNNNRNINQNTNENQFRTKRELFTTASLIDHLILSNNLIQDGAGTATTTTTTRTKFIRTTSVNNNKNKLDINILKRQPFDTETVLNLEKRSNTPQSVSSVPTRRNDKTIVNSGSGELIRRLNVSSYVNTTTTSVNLADNHIEHQSNGTDLLGKDNVPRSKGTEWPMPPVHDHSNASSVSDWGVLVLILSAVVLTVALGLVTCVLSHYRSVAGLQGAAHGGTAAGPHDAAQTPTTAPMLSVVSAGAAAGVGGMDRLRGGRAARELAATRDHQVRLHAVHTDIAINLPPSIALPDGEEHPFTNSRLHLRDPEQESEIHQKCIRPPPNRTVLESESPPPYRSSSAGLLGSTSGSSSSGGGSSEWSGGSAPLVVRCHSMSSSTSKRPEAGSSGQKTDFLQRTVKIFTGKKNPQPTAPTLPVVIVPTRPRRTSNDPQHQQQQQHQQPQQNNSSGRPKPSV